MHSENVKEFDPALFKAVEGERQRQENHIELIASENYVSHGIMALQGSVLTNKYAEGYPGKRYYGGCEYVDIAENLAIERAKTLFGAAYANVQPHSGAQANAAAIAALIEPGATLLGMALYNGGHLTHGSKVNFSGKFYHSVAYGVDPETGRIDYESVRKLAHMHRPKLIIAGFSAYSRIIDWQEFREIADEIGAYLLVDMAHVAGLVAGGLYPNPIPVADVVTTTTHKTLRGPRGGMILAREHPVELHKKLNSAVFPGQQGGPLMHVIAAKALCFLEAMQPEFKQYQKEVVQNAMTLAQALQQEGMEIISGGTDNHLMLVSLRDKNISGKVLEQALGRANITVNKNTIPNDPASPFVTSGIRLGTPAATTRGFKAQEMHEIARWITRIAKEPENNSLLETIKEEVLAICQRFPVYAQQQDS